MYTINKPADQEESDHTTLCDGCTIVVVTVGGYVVSNVATFRILPFRTRRYWSRSRQCESRDRTLVGRIMSWREIPMVIRMRKGMCAQPLRHADRNSSSQLPLPLNGPVRLPSPNLHQSRRPSPNAISEQRFDDA